MKPHPSVTYQVALDTQKESGVLCIWCGYRATMPQYVAAPDEDMRCIAGARHRLFAGGALKRLIAELKPAEEEAPVVASDDERDPWGSDARYPVSDWQFEVANGETRRGYWDWVDAKREENEE